MINIGIILLLHNHLGSVVAGNYKEDKKRLVPETSSRIVEFGMISD
jgi:hypothetical protein